MYIFQCQHLTVYFFGPLCRLNLHLEDYFSSHIIFKVHYCRGQSRARAGRPEGDLALNTWADVWPRCLVKLFAAEHTSSSRVKDVWRTRRHSFTKEYNYRSVRRLISRERRSVTLEAVWGDSLSWWDGLAVSWPFHLLCRRGGRDDSSRLLVIATELPYTSSVLPSRHSDGGNVVFAAAKRLTRFTIVLKLRLFLWVINAVLYIHICCTALFIGFVYWSVIFVAKSSCIILSL